jgi:hypothetical protein
MPPPRIACRWRLASRRALLLTTGVLSLACVGTPRIEDAPAPRDYFRAAQPARRCAHRVELLRSAAEVQRPYRELASISASCYPGTPTVCENRLTERACDLQADAVILLPSAAGGTPLGASTQSQVSSNGKAVVWQVP